MPRQYFSPYAPRRRRSTRLVLIWVSLFVFILYVTWYLSRHREQTKPYVEEFMHPGAVKGAREARDAGEARAEGR